MFRTNLVELGRYSLKGNFQAFIPNSSALCAVRPLCTVLSTIPPITKLVFSRSYSSNTSSASGERYIVLSLSKSISSKFFSVVVISLLTPLLFHASRRSPVKDVTLTVYILSKSFIILIQLLICTIKLFSSLKITFKFSSSFVTVLEKEQSKYILAAFGLFIFSISFSWALIFSSFSLSKNTFLSSLFIDSRKFLLSCCFLFLTFFLFSFCT
mmetsp:Transcript_24358/g.21618  ORF Transcript_24358/g.21618 Transcript_24358/m.21618 type:complete len:212 (-) Transcript_24358:70-705(-)